MVERAGNSSVSTEDFARTFGARSLQALPSPFEILKGCKFKDGVEAVEEDIMSV